MVTFALIVTLIFSVVLASVIDDSDRELLLIPILQAIVAVAALWVHLP